MIHGDHNDTTRRFTLECNDTIPSIVIPLTVVIMQLYIPLIILWVSNCISSARAKKIKQEDYDELKNVERNHEMSLDIFRENHPQPVEEYDSIAASELSRINEDYQRRLSEITERREVHVHRSKGKAAFCRIVSLYAYITFWIYLLYVILWLKTSVFGGTVFLALGIISAILIFVTYLIVVRESISSSERKYIKSLSTNVFAVEHIEAIRATQPSILFRAECYHYEARGRTLVYTDMNGNRKTRLDTYQEKVVTNLSIEPFNFQNWSDTSPSQMVTIRDKGITKIKMTLNVEPGDEETAAAIFEQYSAFQNNHLHLDMFVDFSIKKNVRGFKKRLAAFTNNREKPIWVSNALFMVATLLCLSWPYRWAFKSITGKTKFAVSKLVYIRRVARN